MTKDEVEEIMRENGIVVVGEAVTVLANLIAERERNQCIDILERLHERAGDRHNYYAHAARIMKGDL